MIPGAGGAAAAGSLLMVLAALLGAFLLSWWGLRLWHARRGTPRPPLAVWQWIAAVVLSVLPISIGVMLVQMELSQRYGDAQIAEQERLMHITLTRAVVWGDITLPAGSHVYRDMPEGGVERADGQPDLRTVQDIRFPVPVEVGGLWVNALSLTSQLTLELSRPQQFAAHKGRPAEDCAAGYMVQFNAWQERDPFIIPEKAQTLALADWVLDTCYQTHPISVRYWKDGQLVWADVPEYEPQ